MSYVDLMSRQRWMERDHVNRTEAIVRSQISAEEETIINRKYSGALGGYLVLGAQDNADILRLKQVTEAAQLEGRQARVDAARLHQVLDIEEAKARLDAIPPPPEVGEDPHAQARTEASAAHQALLTAAPPDVQQLLATRNPPPPPKEKVV